MHIKPFEELDPSPDKKLATFAKVHPENLVIEDCEPGNQEKAILKREKTFHDNNMVKPLTMNSSEQQDLIVQNKIQKWKYAATVMNQFFLYVSILISMAIYIYFFVQSANIANSPYVIY